MELEKLKNKKILILGLGKEGLDALNFLKKNCLAKKIGVADKNPNCRKKIAKGKFSGVEWHLGENYLKALKKYDLIVKSPGIPIHLPEVEEAFERKKITSLTEIFFENCPGKIIGVTGTKGKGITASLIYSILKVAKMPVRLIGNIGQPGLNFLDKAKKDEFFVYEISSHQLYRLKESPQIAVFTNLYPAHLDYFKDKEEYFLAKKNIFLWQKKDNLLIYNAEDKNLKKFVQKAKSKKIPVKNFSEIIKKYRIKNLFLKNFYPLNLALAVRVGEIFNLKKSEIEKGIENFKPLPHRLELVGKFKKILFIDDSLSTIPESTIFALNSLGNKIGSLILGGYDSKLDYKNLAKEILKKRIKTLILFPETGNKIWREIIKFKNKKRWPRAILVQKMRDAVKLAFWYTEKGKICLLSPGSPSFGLFKDYRERGNLFKKYVRYYGRSR
jgi:UDP-N-acetylmuramoylalanine--D-glutamate ligase